MSLKCHASWNRPLSESSRIKRFISFLCYFRHRIHSEGYNLSRISFSQGPTDNVANDDFVSDAHWIISRPSSFPQLKSLFLAGNTSWSARQFSFCRWFALSLHPRSLDSQIPKSQIPNPRFPKILLLKLFVTLLPQNQPLSRALLTLFCDIFPLKVAGNTNRECHKQKSDF